MPDTLGLVQPGLSNTPPEDWPKPPSAADVRRPIELLDPKRNREHHDYVRDYIIRRLEMSERNMQQFHARWRAQEMKVQAYIDLPDWEKELKEATDAGKPPKITQIVIPYSFATISTITTYLLHTFCGRRPIYQVSTYKDETVGSSQRMETVLQYNADHTRIIREFAKFFNDTQLYGVGIFRNAWVEDRRIKTVWRDVQMMQVAGIGVGRTERRPFRETVLSYQGNMSFAQDPWMFFPDPRVPMTEVNTRGEFCFWRNFEGRHVMKELEASGEFMWVDQANPTLPKPAGYIEGASARDFLSRGVAHPGSIRNWTIDNKIGSFYQVDQGTVRIIPKELGLGTGEQPELWMFTILNKDQVVQATPLGHYHNKHPVSVAEPYSLGYGFGQPGLADYLGPLQDSVSWLFNSHIDNVRRVLNDMIVYDPSMIEKQDLKRPGPGKMIRLKKSAMGQDVRAAIQQLNVQDVTQAHVGDAETFMRIGQMISAVADNVLGLQDAGGRKTATEVRTSGEAAASRLAAQARIISAQAITDKTSQWVQNIQQFQTEEFYLQLVGEEGRREPIHISPEHIAGDFTYPVHDGTLPLDKVALFDIWQQVFAVVLQDQQMRMAYDLPKMFEFIAELGGARNIEAMRIRDPAQLETQLQAGNVIPAQEAVTGSQIGGVNPVEADPAARLAGELG